MATVNVLLRTCGLLFTVCLFARACGARRAPPAVGSLAGAGLYNYQDGGASGALVRVRGAGLGAGLAWGATAAAGRPGARCRGAAGGAVRELAAGPDGCVLAVRLPATGAEDGVYLCLFFDGRWIHQGKIPGLDPLEMQKSSQNLLAGLRENVLAEPLVGASSPEGSGAEEATTADVLKLQSQVLLNDTRIQELLQIESESLPVLNAGDDAVPGQAERLQNLKREPFVVDVSNDIDDTSKLYLEDKQSEYLSQIPDQFDGNLDDLDAKTLPRDKWIDLTHDIDVNYDELGAYRPNNAPADRLKYLTQLGGVGEDVEIVSVEKKAEAQSPSEDQNTWNYFKDVSSDRTVPGHWIDLSHDIDVNYPGGGVVLDVEGLGVDKNVFDEDFEDIAIEPLTREGETDAIEPLDKRFDSEHEFQNARRKRDVSTDASAPSGDPKASTPPEPRLATDPDVPAERAPVDNSGERLRIEALRVEHADRDPSFSEEGVPELLAGTEASLRIFGKGITEDTIITFTHQINEYEGSCLFPVTGSFKIVAGSVTANSAKVTVNLPKSTGESFFMCAKRPESAQGADAQRFLHQGREPWLQLRSYAKLLPLWATLGIIATCLLFSALFSGLNLGLLSLDRTELKILCNTGTDREKEYARIIQPVRDHGNYLLCSILLGNVAVNSTFTILLDDLTSGVFAVIFSTVTIVLLGEITPQAICSRHGLAVGARTIHVTKAVMAITFPLSYPVSRLLDFLLGEEIGNVYNRERLKELVKVTNDINDLDKDEVNIISGALEMRKKTVLEIMTKIEDVFMLDYEAVLDFETVSEIMKSGFSRIPVFENKRTSIMAMLYVKDLAFVDPDDNTPLKTLCQFYQNPCNFVFEDVTLDVIFRQFKEGHKGHLAFVQRVNSEGEGDPFYETIGLVTLEDVIEELIQAEIMDETDVFTDNKSKRRRNRPPNKLQDFAVFAERRENQRIRISPQLTLATFQYLSTLDAFKPDTVSETILRRMLKQDIIHHIKFRNKERLKSDPTTLIYEQGKAVDYFVLILEGRVEVTVGRESLTFESGPFTYFGSQALMQNVCIAESPAVPPTALGSLQSINMDSMLRYTFIPDYSVRAVTEVFYVSVKRSLYLAAKRATLMEKCAGGRHKGSDDAGEQFDDEVEKLLHSLEEEGSPVENRSPSHHLNSHPVSPSNPNGSLRASRHQSPVKQLAQLAEPEYMDAVPHETNTLLPDTDS